MHYLTNLFNLLERPLFIFFHMFSAIKLSEWKKCVYVFQKLCWFGAIKLLECQKNTVHKQPSVFNTTYTIQSRVNCPNVFSEAQFILFWSVLMCVSLAFKCTIIKDWSLIQLFINFVKRENNNNVYNADC